MGRSLKQNFKEMLIIFFGMLAVFHLYFQVVLFLAEKKIGVR